MSTATTNYALVKPAVNSAVDADLWGSELNDDLDSVDTLLRSGICIDTNLQTTSFTAVATISSKIMYLCSAGGGAITATLPTAASAGDGAVVFFKKLNSNTNNITIARASSDVIDGETSKIISTQYNVIGLVSNGVSTWNVLQISASVFTGDSGSGGTTGLVPAPAAGDAAKRYMLGAGGSFTSQTCIQRVSTETGAVATGTTVMPYDDSIPQNTEGDQYMTLAITPKSATSKLRIDVNAYVGISTGFNISAALFQDSTASALAAGVAANTTGTAGSINFTHIMTSGTTSATTFKVRIGPSGAATVTFNGLTGSRKFGGVMASSISITEYVE